MHYIKIAEQLGIKLDKEAHKLSKNIYFIILVYIDEFLVKKEKEKNDWIFRITNIGSYWINPKKKKAEVNYPFIEELKNFVEDRENEILEKNRNLKKELGCLENKESEEKENEEEDELQSWKGYLKDDNIFETICINPLDVPKIKFLAQRGFNVKII